VQAYAGSPQLGYLRYECLTREPCES